MLCEKCWSNAYTRAYGTGKSQYECYLELLEERKDNPCPPEAQSNNSVQRTGESNEPLLDDEFQSWHDDPGYY